MMEKRKCVMREMAGVCPTRPTISGISFLKWSSNTSNLTAQVKHTHKETIALLLNY